MVAAHHRDAGNDEQDQHQELRGGKGRLRAGGREFVQVCELLERLHDADEDVEIEREDGGAERWLGLFEQFPGLSKWSLCRG